MAHEQLKATQYLPGQTGNPNGRPKKSPITSHLEFQLEQAIPDSLKSQIPVEMLGVFGKVPTFGEYMAFKLITQVVGKGDIFAAKEILDRVEGKVSQKAEISGEIGIKSILVPERIATQRSESIDKPDFGE